MHHCVLPLCLTSPLCPSLRCCTLEPGCDVLTVAVGAGRGREGRGDAHRFKLRASPLVHSSGQHSRFHFTHHTHTAIINNQRRGTFAGLTGNTRQPHQPLSPNTQLATCVSTQLKYTHTMLNRSSNTIMPALPLHPLLHLLLRTRPPTKKLLHPNTITLTLLLCC